MIAYVEWAQAVVVHEGTDPTEVSHPISRYVFTT